MTPGAAPTILLQRPVLLIGRHPECDIRIALPKISRRHCCVALAYDRLLIRDLGSTNGLRVNGVLVEEARLEPGDEVAIGPILYRVEVEAPRPAPPPQAARRPAQTKATKPASLPSLPTDSGDDDLIPLDL
jgi:pSer/pThr/pTyr-binding forkhead associated (FHA) protein